MSVVAVEDGASVDDVAAVVVAVVVAVVDDDSVDQLLTSSDDVIIRTAVSIEASVGRHGNESGSTLPSNDDEDDDGIIRPAFERLIRQAAAKASSQPRSRSRRCRPASFSFRPTVVFFDRLVVAANGFESSSGSSSSRRLSLAFFHR